MLPTRQTSSAKGSIAHDLGYLSYCLARNSRQYRVVFDPLEDGFAIAAAGLAVAAGRTLGIFTLPVLGDSISV